MIYEWDSDKRLKNIEKHGYDLKLGVHVFEAPDKLTIDSHRPHEKRWMDIAKIDGEVMALTLTYTIRADAVRFISLRKASRKERNEYTWAKSLE